MPSFDPSSTPPPQPGEPSARPASRRLVVPVPAAVEPGDAPSLCGDVTRELEAGGVEAVVCDAESAGRGSLGTIDLLARLALLARRAGCRLELEHSSPELDALVRFVGLDGALPCPEDLGVEGEG